MLAEYSDLIHAILTIHKKTKKRIGLLIDDAQNIFHYPHHEVQNLLWDLFSLKEDNVADIILVFSEMSQVYRVNQSIFIKNIVVTGHNRPFSILDIGPISDSDFLQFAVKFLEENKLDEDKKAAQSYIEEVGCNFKLLRLYLDERKRSSLNLNGKITFK